MGTKGLCCIVSFPSASTLQYYTEVSLYPREHESIVKEIKKFLDLASAQAQEEGEEGERNEYPRDEGRQKKKPAKQKKDD